eukprot:491664-Rhodomonas_salina.1
MASTEGMSKEEKRVSSPCWPYTVVVRCPRLIQDMPLPGIGSGETCQDVWEVGHQILRSVPV